MKNSVKVILGLLAVAAVSILSYHQTQDEPTATARFLATTYTTTSTRTNNVNKLCPAGTTRSSLVDAADLTSSASQRKALDDAMGIDGYVIYHIEIC